jgi:hypothetical protein
MQEEKHKSIPRFLQPAGIYYLYNDGTLSRYLPGMRGIIYPVAKVNIKPKIEAYKAAVLAAWLQCLNAIKTKT